MRQVSVLMTGEALLEELMHEISNVWKLPCSAVENIKQHLSKPQHSQFIEEIKVKLKDSNLNLDLMKNLHRSSKNAC